MKPLLSIALGLVVIAGVAPLHGYDLLADPLGWVLVHAGLNHAPLARRRRGAVRGSALLAAAISVVLWFPAVTAWIARTDPALIWAVNLPQLGFTGLLCLALAETAVDTDRAAARWLRTAMLLIAASAVLPVLAHAGAAPLIEISYLAAALTMLLLICLMFVYSGRSWARVPAE